MFGLSTELLETSALEKFRVAKACHFATAVPNLNQFDPAWHGSSMAVVSNVKFYSLVPNSKYRNA